MIRTRKPHPAPLDEEHRQELRELILHPTSFVIAASLLLAFFVLGRSALGTEAPQPTGIIRLVPPEPDAREVQGLLAKLADPSWTVRQEAADALIAMGPAVLPAIDQTRRTSADLTTRSALESVELQIGLNLARAGRPIYLRLERADAAQAVRELARQAGVTVQVDDRRLRGLELDGEVNGLTWWPAMLALCEEHDLDVRPGEGGFRITRATDGPSRTVSRPVVTEGPFILFARGSRYERTLTFDRTPVVGRNGSLLAEQQETLRQMRFVYDFEAMLETRFALSGRCFSVALTHASDDAGNMLIPGGTADAMDLGREIADAAARRGAGAEMAATVAEAEWSSGRLRFSVPLQYPASPGQTLRLAGRIRGLAGAELYELRTTAADLARGMTCQVAGERVHVRLEPSVSAGRWTLSIESVRTLTPELGELIASSFATAELTNAGGDRFRRGATHTSTEDGRFACRLEFIGTSDETSTPSELTWRVPRRALELDVPFAFENLPMP